MIIIRKATIDDLMGMQNANLHNLPENYHFKYYLYHCESWPQASYVATTKTADGTERVVGYSLAKMDEEAPQNADTPPNGHITSLSVMRSYRKLGIAEKLMRQSCELMSLTIMFNILMVFFFFFLF